MRSNKKDNPLKVGRFGIGFNTVYHITDLPSIVSGDTVAFLDPHEKYFVRGEPGQAFSMEDPLLAENHDQFDPFHMIFNCNLNQGSYFKGTLFRFPLRTKPSKLSSKIYTKSMVKSLFNSFQHEASVILHFLKNIDTISLHERENRGTISRFYTVKISDGSKSEVRKKRKELTSSITPDGDFSTKSVFYTLEVEEQRKGKSSQKKKWFMANQVGTEETQLVELAQELKLLPWIGIAFPVNTDTSASDGGRIFCFLPLPPDADCRTGLPVHVNGYFGLTDNRRSLKWPGPDCQNDNTAEWNQLLLRMIGSSVYASLIENMVLSGGGSSSAAHAQLVYSAIPRYSDVKEDWRCLLEPFFRKILTKDIFYTSASGKVGWIDLGEAILDRSLGTSKEVKQVVLSTLLEAGQPVVTVPQNVLEMIDNYSQASGWGTIKQITPPLLRNVLRKSANVKRGSTLISSEKKLLLLEYALQDTPRNAADLSGVPLLPLENGEFCAFQESFPSVRKVFIASAKHSVALLPSAKHCLLRESIPLSLKQKLMQLTCSNRSSISPTQLYNLTPDDVLQLLWENLPSKWSREHFPEEQVVTWSPKELRHPPVAWLPLVWKWIVKQYPNDLSQFEGMPLIPLSVDSSSHLARLCRHSKIIVAKHSRYRGTLPSTLHQFLKNCGCSVVEDLPQYLKHENILEYVSPPTPEGLLRVLMVADSVVVSQLLNTEDEVKLVLRSMLSKLTNTSSQEVAFLRTLPIFKAVDGKNFLPCVNNSYTFPVAPRNFSLPSGIQVIDRKKIISSSEEESFRLLRMLNMNVSSTADLLMAQLEGYISSSGYKNLEKNKLMLWILEKMEILVEETPSFLDFLRQLSFVPTASDTRKSPCELYDHSDDVLCQLLLDKPDAFPAKAFSEPMRKRRDDLRVRCRNNLSAQNLLEITNIKPSSPQNSLKKGKAILELLKQRPNLLTDILSDGTLLSDRLSKIAWLPRVLGRPEKYPSFMPWYDGDHVCKPQDMCPSSFAFLVGASVPLFDEKLVSREVQDSLGVSKQYKLAQVVKQLRLAITSWDQQLSEPSGMELIRFQDSLKQIYSGLSKKKHHILERVLEEARLTNWVWHGNGFSSPDKVALSAHFPSNISLHPHLFLLPKEFRGLEQFFMSFGVKKEFTDDDLLCVLENIKAKHDSGGLSTDIVNQDLDSCRVILEWIVREGRTLSEDTRTKLLIPVHTTTRQLRLEPCNTCTYCDREFLRRGGSENNITTDFHLIHKAIPDYLASSLGVPRLSSRLVAAESIGFEIEEAGQFEPLTTRLRNILQEYKEGVAIFKELIQNADDAGASKVCFVVDWRENPDEKVLCPGMAKCQGPALWAYNNAMFSKKDFENINMLAGETKKEDLDKIGRFGLGFNAVYHLTDMPSFISAEYFVAFDPNMNHIVDLVGRSSRPGLKINLATTCVLSLFPDQFQPYQDLFGCNTKDANTGEFCYEGTLFRFPLRTKEQAEQSNISQDRYSHDDMCRVLEALKQSSSTLLLFSQNIKIVRVFEIRKDSDPTRSLGEPVISISKGVEKVSHTNNSDKFGKGTFLRNCFNWWKLRPTNSGTEEEGPRRTELLKISVSVKESKLTNTTEPIKQQNTWLVNSCSGFGTSVHVAESEKGHNHGLLPVSGAAVQLSFNQSKDELSNIANIHSVPGEVFTFLPLSFSSGLPVHVNGYFSVLSNRRGIWEEGVGEHDSLKPFEAKWNAALMEDALAESYLQLLEVVRSYSDKSYVFHSLWPNPNLISHAVAWRPFMDAFFRKIIDERKPLFYCYKEWRPLQDCFILDSKLSKVPECLSIMNILGKPVLSMPEFLLQGFKSSGKTATITEGTLTEERFLREHFFPNVAKIPAEQRDSVLLHVLDRRLSKHLNDYDDLFRLYPCFSCSKDGKTLRKASELVHPRGQAACLFSEEEKKFPVEERFLTKERAMMLEDLGMVKDRLSWDGICGRAEWVSNHGSKEREERAGHLVNYLVRFLESPSPPEPTAHQKTRLGAARFLPILKKPKDYLLPWKGSNLSEKSMAAANDLYPDNLKVLVGASQLILDESSAGYGKLKNLKSILGLNSKQPQLSDVLVQLDYVIKQVNAAGAHESLKAVCSAIYDHFKKIATYDKHASKRPHLHKELSQRQWMLIKGKMISPERVAMNWDKPDGSPYLYSLPEAYTSRYIGLVKWYGVKEKFTFDDFLKAIWKLRADTDGKKLSNQQLAVLLNFLEEICTFQDLKNLDKPLPLPSRNSILHDSTELSINDTPWLEPDDFIEYVHDKIPAQVAYQCGAKPLRTSVLSRCSEPIGQPFGQHELLTDRLNGILKSYPADEGILKELLQNADDAKASEIHFVFDPRTHDSKHVFSDAWKELQGPAICVYNDQRFSQDDIQGIQNLGIGSKVDDAEKTGQYGIGFNAVYHLTDCPCFISDDDVLCVSDPLLRYVPGASLEHPGRLFNQFNDTFKRNFKDVINGFLGEFFKLKGGTMFRLPLRRRGLVEPKISDTYFTDEEVRSLMISFRIAAKEMLLFLNNVKKISISEIKNGKLDTYSVSCTICDEKKRIDFSQKIKQYKKMSTEKIPWYIIHYTMIVSDSNKAEQQWLVSQSLGCRTYPSEAPPIPDGAKWGLLPRAGIAARFQSRDPGYIPSPVRYRPFCFLPLPTTSSLPVHVNGHFALDSARRDLWHDPNPSDERTAWNEFVKRQVVAPTYASLILEARDHIKGHDKLSDRRISFASELDTEVGLKWYHELFPSTSRADSWTTVGVGLYMYLSDDTMPILPVAQSVPRQKQPDYLEFLNAVSSVTGRSVAKRVLVDWCCVSDVYFSHGVDKESQLLEKILLDVGLPLLSHTPPNIYAGFKASGKTKETSPVAVTDFLRTRSLLKESLPKNVKDTALLSYHNVYALLTYCSKCEDFFEKLQGLPLLLTQDHVLRCFTAQASVFCSRFSDLLPSKPELFLHKHMSSIFDSDIKKCSGIVKEFDIIHLSKFKDAVLPLEWQDDPTVHQPWNPTADSVPSKEWIQLLWKFIHHVSSTKDENEILESIRTWPIIPTKENCLVPVAMSKTVLNASSLVNSDSSVDSNRRDLLSKLNCPQLQDSLMPHRDDFRNSTGSATVLKHYLALIQSPKDILGLLDHTFSKNNGQEQTKLNDGEIQELLMFLQSDISSLSTVLLKKLPFYKTTKGKHTHLPTTRTVYEIPYGVPQNDFDILSEVANCVFLSQAPMLRTLYAYIKIQEASSVQFYLSIVLKHFNQLTPVGREYHLKYIRDVLLPGLPSKKVEYQLLTSALKALPFIPDQSGTLYCACKYYDARNTVFATFLPKEMFPPAPFDSDEWQDFLHKVGLQTVVTQKHFEEYATRVACEASKPESARLVNVSAMSRILVSCLFESFVLQDGPFLQKISGIRFLPADKIRKEFLAIHAAYGVQPGSSNYIPFRGSVVSNHKPLVWSSAPILSRDDTLTGDNRQFLVEKLGIHTKPPIERVLSHAKNISGRFNATKEKEIPNSLRFTLSSVMKQLYGHFKNCCHCSERSTRAEQCSQECQSVCDDLRSVPIILINERILVRGNQLTFGHLSKSIEPFMFEVPRDLVQYEHFLKRLGAQEYPTPRQYANVLQAVKDSCEDKKMHPNEKKPAFAAVLGLFYSLHKLAQKSQQETKESDKTQSLSDVRVLYLPTEDGYLKASTELFVNDLMEEKTRLKEHWNNLLVDFTRKDQEPADKLVELLPAHLKVNKLSCLMADQLNPSCVRNLCVLDNDPENRAICTFIQTYRELMCAPEFSDALIRLYKHQEEINQVPESIQRSLKKAETCLTLCCMQSIETRYVSRTTEEPVPGSEKEVDCFLQEDRGRFKILVKHGGGDNLSILHGRLSSFIHRITERHIKEEQWRFLMMILGVKEPADISSVLDEARISRNVSSNWDEPTLGDVIPVYFHFLLNSDIDYYLREGELVGYEMKEEDENNDPIFVYAKIIEQTSEGEGKFRFDSRYKIDVGGEEPIEVNKHKLYKFDRGGTKRKKEASNTCSDVVPYVGAESSTNETEDDKTPSKPTNLEEAKKEVAEALKEIWNLPESERASAIRRLIKRWHPDKNPDCVELANEVMKFLLNEVERLKKGGVPGYREPGSQSTPHPSSKPRPQSSWDGPDFSDFSDFFGQRARRQRRRYDEWRGRADDSTNQTEPPNRNEADRWLKQAREDLNAARFLFESENRAFYTFTCFHCHQTVEKCLKALLFAKGRIERIDLEKHEVMSLAYRASGEDQSLRRLPVLARQFCDPYYTKTRYPVYKRYSADQSIPSEQFTRQDADTAMSKAREILQLIADVLET